MTVREAACCFALTCCVFLGDATQVNASYIYSIASQSPPFADGTFYSGTIEVSNTASADGILAFSEIESYSISVYVNHQLLFSLSTPDGGYVGNLVGIDSDRIYVTTPTIGSSNALVLGKAYPGPYVDWVNRISVAPYVWTSFKSDPLLAAVIGYYPGGTVTPGGTVIIATRTPSVPEPASFALLVIGAACSLSARVCSRRCRCQ